MSKTSTQGIKHNYTLSTIQANTGNHWELIVDMFKASLVTDKPIT